MKKITTTGSVRKADASLDPTLNPVELSSKEIVAWGIAFPRLASDTSEVRPALCVAGGGAWKKA